MARKFYNVRLGMQPIAWVNDDMHDMGDFIGFEQIIREMREAGFEGTELGRKYPRDPSVLREMLKGEDLVLTSGWCDVNFIYNTARTEEFVERFKTHTQFLKEMGCRQVVVCEVGQSTNWDPDADGKVQALKKMNDEQWKMLAKELNICGAFAKDLGMELVYHVHTGTVVETLEEAARLCEMTDDDKVFILMDTGHLTFCGVDNVKFAETIGRRIRYVHLKDIRLDVLKMVKQFKMDFNSAVRVGVFTMPGDGDIDYSAIFDALEGIGYQGWLVVEAEQNAEYANPLGYAINCREYLRGLLGQ